MRIETARLVLRRWHAGDVDALLALVSHPDVARWLPYGTRDDAVAAIERYERSFEERGFGRFAVVDRGTEAVVGRVGLMHAPEWSATAEQDEIGWAIARERWGEGLAAEAARAAIDDAFERVALERILAWTTPDNVASRRVMEKSGMRHGGSAPWKGREHVWYDVRRAPPS